MLSIPKILNADQKNNSDISSNKEEKQDKIIEESSTENKEENKEDQTKEGGESKEETKEANQEEDVKGQTEEDKKEDEKEDKKEDKQQEEKANTDKQKENERKIRQSSIMKKILPKDDTENPCNFCGQDLCECFRNAELYSVYAKNRCYMAYEIRYKDRED